MTILITPAAHFSCWFSKSESDGAATDESVGVSTPARAFVVTAVQALDKVAYTPFDLRVALPK